ncbi:MAG: replication/maintenance protein RepL [Candidatus Nanoarchaeia archaeon]
MIDFGCKTFNIEEIIKCALGLTKAECLVFRLFFDNPADSFTTQRIAEQVGLNLTTVQKAVKKLHDSNIIIRYQHNLENGGYVFTYEACPKKQIRKILKNIINTWAANVGKAIERW